MGVGGFAVVAIIHSIYGYPIAGCRAEPEGGAKY